MFYGPTDNWSWDPSYYYAQLRSPIIENDLDFRNETVTNGYVTKVTVTGLQGSAWPVGPSILWSPFFLLAHCFVSLLAPAKATGFSSPYIALVSFGSALYGIIGLFLLYRICRRFGDQYIAAIAVALALGATPLFFYIFRQPIMAHTTSLLVSATLVLFYVHLTENQCLNNQSGLCFGVLLGLSFLTRWAGILYVVLPMTYFGTQLIGITRTKNSSALGSLVRQVLVMIVTFGLTISPQLSLWRRLYGSFLASPQRSDSFVATALPSNLLKIFLDTNRGLMIWSLFSFIGLLGMMRIPNPKVRISAMLYMGLQIVLIGYRVDWYGGGGYGPRYFIEALPLLTIGFVCLAQPVVKKPFGKLLVGLCAIALIAHQAVLVYAVEHASEGWLNWGDYLRGQPIGLDWQRQSALRLFAQPSLWLAPRLVAQNRQTILVNYVTGVHDFRAYVISATAAGLASLIIIVASLMPKFINESQLPAILLGAMVYMVAWSFFFMVVG